MDRQLLSKILIQMKKNLKEGKDIGDMKVGALLALGHQLEAIFYYLGHELGTILKIKPVKDVNQIPEELKRIINEYSLGKVEITESTEEIVQLNLRDHSSIKDLMKKGIKTTGSFCSFEAGLLAGVVEKLSDRHCFAQELGCSLQTGENYCEFMIVFQSQD
jgi:predicted hydrocarbon binding protein